MRVATVNVYTFTELPEEAKAKAISEYRDFLSESGLITEQVSETIKWDIEHEGYPTDDIQWSLNYCQGDGVAFYGRLETETLVRLRNRLMPGTGRTLPFNFLSDNVTMTIKSNSTHYNHYNTMYIDVDIYNDLSDKRREALKAFIAVIEDDMKDLSKRMEQLGYHTMEDMDDTYISECLNDSEYEFTVDGSIYVDLDSDTQEEIINIQTEDSND